MSIDVNNPPSNVLDVTRTPVAGLDHSLEHVDRPARPVVEPPAHVDQDQPTPATSVGACIAAPRVAQKRAVEDLTRQTYIRGGVIRGIETDDFRACGGDCYARGHLRLLGQALQLDVSALIETFNRENPDTEVLAED